MHLLQNFLGSQLSTLLLFATIYFNIILTQLHAIQTIPVLDRFYVLFNKLLLITRHIYRKITIRFWIKSILYSWLVHHGSFVFYSLFQTGKKNVIGHWRTQLLRMNVDMWMLNWKIVKKLSSTNDEYYLLYIQCQYKWIRQLKGTYCWCIIDILLGVGRCLRLEIRY